MRAPHRIGKRTDYVVGGVTSVFVTERFQAEPIIKIEFEEATNYVFRINPTANFDVRLISIAAPVWRGGIDQKGQVIIAGTVLEEGKIVPILHIAS